MSQLVDEKARRYCAGGLLAVHRVDEVLVVADVTGSADEPYRVVWHRDVGWRCSCPANTRCGHIGAAQLVVPRDRPEPTP